MQICNIPVNLKLIPWFLITKITSQTNKDINLIAIVKFFKKSAKAQNTNLIDVQFYLEASEHK